MGRNPRADSPRLGRADLRPSRLSRNGPRGPTPRKLNWSPGRGALAHAASSAQHHEQSPPKFGAFDAWTEQVTPASPCLTPHPRLRRARTPRRLILLQPRAVDAAGDGGLGFDPAGRRDGRMRRVGFATRSQAPDPFEPRSDPTMTLVRSAARGEKGKRAMVTGTLRRSALLSHPGHPLHVRFHFRDVARRGAGSLLGGRHQPGLRRRRNTGRHVLRSSRGEWEAPRQERHPGEMIEHPGEKRRCRSQPGGWSTIRRSHPAPWAARRLRRRPSRWLQDSRRISHHHRGQVIDNPRVAPPMSTA